MAYSTLLSLENIIDQILDHDRFSVSSHAKEQIRSLHKCVISLQAFLKDFPEKAKNLEGRIRDVAAEAEDIIEWFSWKQTRNKYRYVKHISILCRDKFESQLTKVKDEMDSITADAAEMMKSVQPGDCVGANSPSQAADTGEIDVVAFNEDLLKIKDSLCGWAPQLQVLPIFGMGGIGKTTLARNAYNDQLIIEHFDIRVWVTISQVYTEGRILLDLLDSMKEFSPSVRKETLERYDQGNESSPAKVPEESNSEMALKVHKILTGRRFLIVMDDIWSTKVLDDVKKLFPNDNNGSRILLTTRLKEVASYADSSDLSHEMRFMDEDQSWNLLRQKLFVRQDCVPPELERIGREIARSCGGLPLAIVVIAGLLSNKTPTSWEEVARNIRSSLVTTDGQIEKILSLSYSHLPHHLRSCFLYMGGFPEDYRIKATQVIRLWIAENFVKPIGSKRFEDTAEEYLQDLVDRSLIIVTRRKSNGKIKYCNLHDMIREMCIKISKEEKFLVCVKSIQAMKLPKSMKDQRRISIWNSDLNSFSNISNLTIRSILYFGDTLGSLGSFRLLRVLDLLRTQSESGLLSDQVFELFHLRYLALCNSNPIPRTISNFQSLQTLIIKEISDSCLPYEIWSMQQLRHLIISHSSFADIDVDTPALENLQTLRVRNLLCSVAMLNLIPNLTKLHLTYAGFGELLLHNLVHLSRLEKLYLELEYYCFSFGRSNLVVPNSLKKLTLIGWGWEEPYLNIIGPFPNLEVLKLHSFNFMPRVWTTSDEDFPCLKFLLIDESDITQFDTKSNHFPRLKSLLIYDCPNLAEIPECMGEIPTLELIELRLCRESLAASAKRIQEEAQNYEDDAFQLSCIDCKPTEDLTPPRTVDIDEAVTRLRAWRRFGSVEGRYGIITEIEHLRCTTVVDSAAKCNSATTLEPNL